jgi:glycosyltransferase involved in cell wall biosynthesis
MKPCLVYIISQISYSLTFQWTAYSLLERDKYRLIFVLLNKNETDFERILVSQGQKVYRISYEKKRDVFRCIWDVRKILKKEKANIVHSHLFEGGLIGMIAARLAGIPKRIHTRHDAMIHHSYHPHAVKYDKLTNQIATDIIAITKNVKSILVDLENVPEKKITIIHHGFDLNELNQTANDRIEKLTNKYFPAGKPFPVIGVVSRYIEWKGVQYIIPAFIAFKKKYPNAHLILANASGPHKSELKKLLLQIPADGYTEVEFEQDMPALYRIMDGFVHVPISSQSEAFGLVYIEAMAAGLPMIVTLSGIASDIIADRHNAFVVPYQNSSTITSALFELIENSTLAKKMGERAKMDTDNFSINRNIQKLEEIYDA